MTPGLGRRALARFLDAVLLGFVGAAWGYPLDYGLVWLVGHALLIYGYFVAADVLAGRTLAKALLGLRVQGPDGGAVDWASAAKREAFVLVGAVPFVGPLAALAIWVWIFQTARTHPEGEGIHDRWAGGTRVLSA